VPLPIIYKTMRLDCGYRLDFVVERKLVLELKAVERLDLSQAERPQDGITVELQ